jgi:DNA-binding response OmpR family regulator
MDALTPEDLAEAARAEPNASKRVLIAQADRGIHTSLQKVLQGAVYCVTVAADAGETTACFTQQEPDLLLLDLDFPPDALRHLLDWLPTRRSRLPVIGMTTMPENLKPAFIAQFSSVLALPAEVPVLLERIELVLSRGNEKVAHFQK